MNNSLITILLATYNGEEYLSELLDSILEQSYDRWELFIRDDCSSDMTINILHSYEEKDKRIHVEYGTKRLGPLGNFKYLIASLSRKAISYVMFCDQDDIWDKKKIELTYKYMSLNEMRDGAEVPRLVFCGKELVDENLVPIKTYDANEGMSCKLWDILVQNPIYGCTMMINKALLIKAGYIPEYILMHDYYYALYASSFGSIDYINFDLIKYRQHANNVTGGNNNFSIVAKIKNWSKINKKIHNNIQQNYTFCLSHYNKKPMIQYVSLIQSGPIVRFVKALAYGYRVKGILPSIRLLFVLLTFKKDSM